MHRPKNVLCGLMGIERTLFEPNLTEAEMIDRAYDERGQRNRLPLR